VQNIRGTDLIAINVMHTSPEDARDIAQAVYESYKERRLEAESKLTDGANQEREDAIIAHSAVVEDKRKQLQQFELKMASAGNPVAEADPSNETLRLKKHLTLLQQAKNDDERMLLAAMMLDGENPVKAIYQEYLKAGEDLDQMQKNGLGDVHPNHVAQKKRIRELSEKIQSSLSKYVQELQAQVGDEAANPATEVTSNDNLVLRTQIQTLSDELATQEKILQEMKQKFATDEINLKQPQNMIELHEVPEIAKVPSSPRVNRMLLLGGVGLPFAVLLLGLPLTVFIHLVSRR
jgi:capsular polysaccharide biosynthesis protein